VNVILRGGRLIDPASQRDEVRHLVIVDGLISEKMSVPTGRPSRSLEVEGQWVFPGFVDLHSTISSEADLQAALAAGYATVFAAPESKWRSSPVLRLSIAPALTQNLEGCELGEVSELARCLSNGSAPLPKASVLRRALQYAAQWGVLVMNHAEDPLLSGRGVLGEGETAARLGLASVPRSAETSVVARDLAILEDTGGRLHFSHLTCAGSVALIADAKRRGLAVSADVTPHHLLRDDSFAEGYALAARVWPPLRSATDVAALRAGLKAGTIDAVAVDHRRVEVIEAEHPFESAAPGVESYPLVWPAVRSLGLSPLRLAEVLAWNPAKLLGLEAGTLEVGHPGDVTVVDPRTGKISYVLVGGEVKFSGEGALQ
jgi:dihydroorotase